jgi:hypothetical protein
MENAFKDSGSFYLFSESCTQNLLHTERTPEISGRRREMRLPSTFAMLDQSGLEWMGIRYGSASDRINVSLAGPWELRTK